MRGVMCTGSNLNTSKKTSVSKWRWTQIAQYQTSIGKKMEEEKKVGFLSSHLIDIQQASDAGFEDLTPILDNLGILEPWDPIRKTEILDVQTQRPRQAGWRQVFFPPNCYVISFTDDIGKRTNPRHGAGDQTIATIPEKTKLGNHSA